MKNKSIVWQSGVIAIGVIVLIALCFYVWKSPEVYSQGMAIVVSAALGAILTAIITRMVIGSQLQSEQEKEKNIKIYEMKMQVYSEFISMMWKLYEDGKIDEEELIKLRQEVFNKLIFLLKKEDVEKLTSHINVLRKYIAGEGLEYIVARPLADITRLLRCDLDISKEQVEDKNTRNEQGVEDEIANKEQSSEGKKKIKGDSIVNLWDAFSNRLEQEEEKPEEKPIDFPTNTSVSVQTDRQYWHMNMANRTIQTEALKNRKNELSLIEWDTNKRTEILKRVRKGDLIFLYNGGNNFLGIFEAIGRRIFYYKGEQLLEEYTDLQSSNPPITDIEQLNKDKEKYDIYGGIDDNADYCSNLIVKPLACMLVRKNDDIAAYRPTICTYWKAYGDDIMIKYYEALNNSKFGKIDDVVIDCDVETFKSLFKIE